MWQTGPLNCTETKILKAAASTHIYFAIFLSQKVVNEFLKCPLSLPLQILWNICPKNQNTQTVEILFIAAQRNDPKNGTDATENKYGA